MDSQGKQPAQEALPSRFLNVATLPFFLSSIFSGFGTGIIFPLITIWQSDADIAAHHIGLNYSSSAILTILLIQQLAMAVSALGPKRSIIWGFGLSALTALTLPFIVSIEIWFVVRPFFGLGIVMAWIAREYWLNLNIDNAFRGKIVGLNALLSGSSFALGSAAIVFTGTETALACWIAVASLALSGLAASMLTRTAAEKENSAKRRKYSLSLARHCPDIMMAGFCFGFMSAAVNSLLPIFAENAELKRQFATLTLSVWAIGRTVTPLAAGYWRDKLGHGAVIRYSSFVLIIASACVAQSTNIMPLMFALLFLNGAACGALNTAASSALGTVFTRSEIAIGSATFVLFYQLGAIVGPYLSGWSILVFPIWGLWLAAIVVGAILAFVAWVFPTSSRG